MPLEDSEWARGKCACKALQYLSYGKPVVVSPVGVNAELFADKPFASLATDPTEWDRALTRWRDDPEARARAAVEGREFVKEHFEVKAWAGRLLGLLLGKDSAQRGA
jgi:glycosyltransferase involved in cell wall biosynthesis